MRSQMMQTLKSRQEEPSPPAQGQRMAARLLLDERLLLPLPLLLHRRGPLRLEQRCAVPPRPRLRLRAAATKTEPQRAAQKSPDSHRMIRSPPARRPLLAGPSVSPRPSSPALSAAARGRGARRRAATGPKRARGAGEGGSGDRLVGGALSRLLQPLRRLRLPPPPLLLAPHVVGHHSPSALRPRPPARRCESSSISEAAPFPQNSAWPTRALQRTDKSQVTDTRDHSRSGRNPSKPGQSAPPECPAPRSSPRRPTPSARARPPAPPTASPQSPPAPSRPAASGV